MHGQSSSSLESRNLKVSRNRLLNRLDFQPESAWIGEVHRATAIGHEASAESPDLLHDVVIAPDFYPERLAGIGLRLPEPTS